jgi:Nodulation protein Z (NodZ)
MNLLHTNTAGRAREFLRREVRRLRDAERRTRVALRLFARTALPAAGSREAAHHEVLVLPGAGYQPGLFSQFATVLGLLEYVHRWPGRYAGLRVDFAEQGLYYDPSAGPNWWDYYFEPLALGVAAAPVRTVSDDEMFYFARRVETSMPRARAAELVALHVRPVARVRDKVDTWVRERFVRAHVIGVHYRGTNKHQDAPRVPYEAVAAAVRTAAPAASAPWKIFVATDEQAFLDFMRARFPGRLACLDMHRSTDGSPIDVVPGDNFRKGEQAVMDCLLLARCDHLVRTASNLSLCATFFNPRLPVALLSRER